MWSKAKGKKQESKESFHLNILKWLCQSTQAEDFHSGFRREIIVCLYMAPLVCVKVSGHRHTGFIALLQPGTFTAAAIWLPSTNLLTAGPEKLFETSRSTCPARQTLSLERQNTGKKILPSMGGVSPPREIGWLQWLGMGTPSHSNLPFLSEAASEHQVLKF